MNAKNVFDSKLLIIHDNQENVKVIKELLNWAGYKYITTIVDPQEVVHSLQSFVPALIVLDLHMPGLDGFELLMQIRSVLKEGSFTDSCVLSRSEQTIAETRA